MIQHKGLALLFATAALWGAIVCIVGRIEIRRSYEARHAQWLEESK